MTADSGMMETKQRLIDAALKLFGEIGYTRASTRAIAEQAGVNEVTLFRHFGNKKNLLFECIRAGNQTGVSQTFREHLTGDYAGDIRIMAGLQMADTRQKKEILRLLLCNAQEVPELQEALILGAANNTELLAGYFREQITAGNVRPELNPLVLAQGFDSLFSSYWLFEHFMGSAPLPAMSDDEVLDSLTTLFIRGTVVNQGA